MIFQADTEAWHKARVGKVTASRIADIMAKTKSGPSASRTNYAAELVAERLTGSPAQSFTNAAMQWGIDTEPHARATYEFLFDAAVGDAAFVDHPTIDMAGASPDGFVGDDGLVEFKCPNTATHIDTLLNNEAPSKYLYQMQWQMACTNRAWCDFVSFDPRMPDEMRMFRARIERDNELIGTLEESVRAFLGEVSETVAQLRERYALEQAA